MGRYQEEELDRMKSEQLNNSRLDSATLPAIKIRDAILKNLRYLETDQWSSYILAVNLQCVDIGSLNQTYMYNYM